MPPPTNIDNIPGNIFTHISPLIQSFFQESRNDAEKDYSDCLYEVFKSYENTSPDVVIEKIEEFFLMAGEDLREGRISEDDFYLKTYPGSLHINLWEMKGLKVNQGKLNKYGDFAESYSEWKKTGTVSERKWMNESLGQYG